MKAENRFLYEQEKLFRTLERRYAEVCDKSKPIEFFDFVKNSSHTITEEERTKFKPGGICYVDNKRSKIWSRINRKIQKQIPDKILDKIRIFKQKMIAENLKEEFGITIVFKDPDFDL